MKPSRIATLFLCCFLLTVFLLQWWQRSSYPFELWLSLLLLTTLCLIGLLDDAVRTFSCFLLAAGLGVLFAFSAVERATPEVSSKTVQWYAQGRNVTLLGTVSDEPDRRPPAVRYTVNVHSLSEDGGARRAVSGRVLATDPVGWPEFSYGDSVRVDGKLNLPGTVKGFRYDHYLSVSGIGAVMYRARIATAGENHGNAVYRTLFALKRTFETRLNRLFPEPHASLAAGLLTGTRRGIPDHLSESFLRSGLTHIVAISGFNITIVIALVLAALFWLPLRWRFLPAALSIIAFTIFVGASASVVRAAVMGILGLVALTVGRKSDVRLAILWTAFFMLIFNPRHLWYDGSFQLSFAAVIGLCELSVLIKPLLTRVPDVLGMREALEATIAAQLSAMPLGILLFGNLSLISPLANILVAPAIPLAMLVTALAGLSSFIAFPVGRVLAFGGWAVLQWIIFVAETCARIPLSSLHIPQVDGTLVLAYYVALFLLVVFVRHAESMGEHKRMTNKIDSPCRK